ncbi:heat-inducible transcriptional repressor HrcA [Sporolituus thermophilus]|uniref:Heat-inducible transcription repressor HrcA n=1 Tax=Sporolituus thermophilus DSM 23256 TaxID=1123285 RepID=A0A1G7NLB8_9FIRM|nr:heat-inducible transcriptional repressor HrcA [Sporolituus thermophilus]SDF74848.1 heat-inducible transcription repressor HrcA [Sporolituus thermophilus DSM 23256]
MDERKRKILQAIIDDYISTAEPVGSRTIARKYNLGVSPATIRNEMADLELLGYLEQPHTSAGRIPSAKGYRFYVDCLLAPQPLSEKEIALIERWYQTKVRRLEEVFQETAKILSRITRNISLVLAPQFSQCAFKYMQFLPLDERRAILVVVADTGFVENKIIEIPNGIAFPELQKIAGAINERLAGLAFDRIKSSLLREIKHDIIPNRALFETALEFIKDALAVERKDRVYTGGTTQVLDQPEFRDVDKVRALLAMLEEEQLLVDILHMQESDGVVVTIGGENKYTGIHDCSMVQATYRVDGQVVGTVAVLGPTRMEYGRIMSVLEFMHRHLGQILKKYGI